MKKIELTIPTEILIRDYLELNSSYKVAKKYNVSATAVKRVLKEQRVLRTQSGAAKLKDISHLKNSKMSTEGRKKLSELAKTRTGENNPFYGKKHSKETCDKLRKAAQKRTEKRNPNYKNGKNIRRPRDFKNADLQRLRNFVFNRDSFTCAYCNTKGDHLHAHHKLPYWVSTEAFLDTDNLITVCSDCHFNKAHNGNWHNFDVTIINDELITKYSFCRERLNELASFSERRCDSLDSSITKDER